MLFKSLSKEFQERFAPITLLKVRKSKRDISQPWVKVLFVTHFDLMFNLNAEFVSQMLLDISLVMGVIPHFMIFIYCKWNTFYLWGKMLPSTDNIKMRQAIWNKNQTMPSWQEPVLHKSPGKGAQWFAESNTIRVKNFRYLIYIKYISQCYCKIIQCIYHPQYLYDCSQNFYSSWGMVLRYITRSCKVTSVTAVKT